MESGVLVFDEFNMLGRERADRADHGELRRVVTAMLQVVDAHRGDSVLVATTNHPALLDSAIWWRFDQRVV
ncbi:MAG: AAA family ATPase [Acidimicrobiaceae bacterium]|nr:AAA family ATPase [Acidimicrobiaceae bacterium]